MEAGYSGTPLQRKLGVKPGMRVAAIGAPDRFAARLEDARVAAQLRGSFELIVFFAISVEQLERRMPALLRARSERGGLWIAWPKRSSGLATDLDDGVVRRLGLATGLVDNKVCAIDETWSALRFVARRA
jgi:hypothetical protein